MKIKPPEEPRRPLCPGSLRIERLFNSRVEQLLTQHLAHMRRISPPGTVHALDLEGLRAPQITLWSAWHDDELAGCGALKALSDRHGEIKAMRTAPAWLRRGVAQRLLQHLVDEARRRGYERLSLETGSSEHFLPAIRLYEKYGFARSSPFADYREHPHSIFMTRNCAGIDGQEG